jgi:uncharacterized protein
MIYTIALLLVSNIFMTIAWYGHLRFRQTALWTVVVISWMIAFFEYCFQVPANRIGFNAGLTGAQLKTIQEIITLTVFVVFASIYLHEPIRWNVVAGFLFIAIGATLIFQPWKQLAASPDAAMHAATAEQAIDQLPPTNPIP